MAVQAPSKPALLTYEAYMAEEEVNLRYDIIDGVRILMSSPTWTHQDIQQNLTDQFRAYCKRTKLAKGVPPPFDILIRRSPLRVRQPDAFLISAAKIQEIGGPPSHGPLEAAPELVVEILSASDRFQSLKAKLQDYAQIGVLECWIVHPVEQCVEMVRLSPDGHEVTAKYEVGDVVKSDVFQGLEVSVNSIFSE
jgi:Uma2 family endonuclease